MEQWRSLHWFVDSSLPWNKYINYIVGKAGKQLYFLKILKRSGVPRGHLLHYYIAVIRPVLEYCSCVRHHSIPHTDYTDWIHPKQALGIILNCGRDTSYAKMLATPAFFFSRAETKYTGKIFFSVNPPARVVSLSFVTTITRYRNTHQVTWCTKIAHHCLQDKKSRVVHKLCLGKLPVKSVQHPIFYTLCVVITFIDSLYSPYFSTVCVP